MDLCPVQMVRAAIADGVHRHVPRASCRMRASSTVRGLTRWQKRAARASVPSRPTASLQPPRSIGRPRNTIACAASLREGRGGVSLREPVGIRPPTWTRPPADGPGTHRRGVRDDPPAGERHHRSAAARTAAAGPSRNQAGHGQSGGSPQCMPRAPVARGEARRGRAASHGRAGAGRYRSGRRRCRGGARSTALCVRGVAAARGRCSRSARVRLLIGLACKALDDEETGGLESGAARAVSNSSEPSRTSPASRRLAQVRHGARHPLTARELHVLRLITAGSTNKAIAAVFVPERANHRPAREQYLQQARRPYAGRRHGLRVQIRKLIDLLTVAGERQRDRAVLV